MDIYAAVTDRIIAQMEQGIIPWEKPWISSSEAVSHATGKPYSLLNQMLLQRPGEYITFKQCQEAGGHIKKGEKASMVVFWKWIEQEDEESGEKKEVPLSKAGDTIITTEVSRLSRSTQQLCELIETIREKKLRLIIIGSIAIDCRKGMVDPMSEAFLQMAGVFSQLELAMIRARVKSGMENAKAKGKRIGRPATTKEDIPAVFFKHYAIFMEGKMNVSELARICGLSRPTVYKYLKMME